LKLYLLNIFYKFKQQSAELPFHLETHVHATKHTRYKRAHTFSSASTRRGRIGAEITVQGKFFHPGKLMATALAYSAGERNLSTALAEKARLHLAS